MNNNLNILIRPEILEFTNSILTKEEIDEIEDLSNCLNNGKEKHDCAVRILKNKIGVQPKRPIFYLNFEINYLPEETRNVVRYAGDYIDQLIKHLAHQKGRFKFLSVYSSLGNNIKRAKNAFNSKLYNALEKYNKLIYIPAKHDFDVKDRPHLFSGKEAVAILFITKKLAEEIITLFGD